jgi:uncharacterized protein (DUF433 family)
MPVEEREFVDLLVPTPHEEALESQEKRELADAMRLVERPGEDERKGRNLLGDVGRRVAGDGFEGHLDRFYPRPRADARVSVPFRDRPRPPPIVRARADSRWVHVCYAFAQMQAFQARPTPLFLGSDGIVRVSGTRVSLKTLVSAFDAGATAEEIVQQYPSLDLSAAYAVISYVLDHRAEVDAYVAKRFDAARAIQATIEAHSPPQGMRARLLARRPLPPGR